MKHNFNLDFIKVIAIVAVVFLHISDGYLLRSDYFGSGLIWYLIFIIRVLAGVSVPMFMMTSGYLTIGKNYPFKQLLKRVFIRLLIPFVFLFMITSWFGGMSAAHLHNSVLRVPLPSLFELTIKFFTAPGNLHFLVALIGLNLLLPVWSLLFSSKEKSKNFSLAKYLIFISFFAMFTISLNLNFNPIVNGEILNEWRWLLWVGYFLLGYLLKVQPKIVTKKAATIIFFVGLIVSMVVSFITRKFLLISPTNELLNHFANLSLDYHSPWVMLTSIGAWALLIKTNFVFLTKIFWQKAIFIGANLSLGVYIFHGVVFGYLDVFKRMGLENMIVWHRPAFAVVGLTLITITISGILTFIFGLIPGLRMLIGNDYIWPFLPTKKKRKLDLTT